MALLIGSYGPTGPAAPNLDIALTARQKAGGKPLGEEREDRMSGVPTAQSPGPAESREPASQRAESSPSRPADETPPLPAETPPLPAEHKRWKRKKIFTPLVLAALGLVLLLLSILFYPSQSTGVSTPPYSRLEITTTSPIFLIGFKVVQVSPALAEMRFTVELPVGKTAPPPGATASLQVAPPLGTSFRDCPAPSCTRVPGVPPTFIWTESLAFKAGKAQADFFVKASSFGVAFNGVNAAAAIPEVMYKGPGNPIMLAAYDIPSAASYDWSSFPTAAVNNSTAIWQVDLAGGDTAAREAVGINSAGQASHDTRTYVAGALLGLAGGAILSAAQVALHAGD